ncbi:unnamed protein product [Brassicogethes aeneus]|uniref:Uncharacterized protein n=1 Tax=Brassicogethes aeneus TaxID=1431903 RepID=A0A9P0BEH9_BRAAE|nr:unnamed protein product [Brassicogethes aeneus]
MVRTLEIEKERGYINEIQRLEALQRKREAEHLEELERLKNDIIKSQHSIVLDHPIEILAEKMSYEDFTKIEDRPWAETLFKNTEIRTGDPTTCKESTIKVVLIEPRDEMTESIQKIYKNKYPELGEMKQDYGSLHRVTKIRTDMEEVSKEEQEVFKIKTTDDNKDIWEKLCRLKVDTEDESCLAMHHLNMVSLAKLQKITEAIFHGTKRKIIIYTTRQKQQETNAVIQGNRETRTKYTYAIIVGKKVQDYKDTLLYIKNAVKDKGTKDIIRTFRRTKDGSVMIVTDRKEEKTKALQRMIKDHMGDAFTSIKGLKPALPRTIHIKGPTRSSTSNCTAPGANQPWSLTTGTGIPQRSDLTRRLSIRTSPAQRATSPMVGTIDNMAFFDVKHSKNKTGEKRNREEGELTPYKKKEFCEVFVLEETREQITSLVAGLAKYERVEKLTIKCESQTEPDTPASEEKETQTEVELPREMAIQQETRPLKVRCVPTNYKVPDGIARAVWTTEEAFRRDYPGRETPKPGQTVAVHKTVTSSVGDKNLRETTTTTWMLMQEESAKEAATKKRARHDCLVKLAEQLRVEDTCSVTIRAIKGVPLESEMMDAIGRENLEIIPSKRSGSSPRRKET